MVPPARPVLTAGRRTTSRRARWHIFGLHESPGSAGLAGREGTSAMELGEVIPLRRTQLGMPRPWAAVAA